MSRRKPAPPLVFPAKIPFVEQLGLELHAMRDGHAEVRVDVAEAHLNAWEVAHGGVVMTMMDVAMAMAARSAHGGDSGVATIEMKTSFMRPAEGQLRAVARVLHRTASLAFCSAEVLDEGGALCAAASATFKYMRALGGRTPVVRPTPPGPETG